jgi:hypothetical protein
VNEGGVTGAPKNNKQPEDLGQKPKQGRREAGGEKLNSAVRNTADALQKQASGDQKQPLQTEAAFISTTLS